MFYPPKDASVDADFLEATLFACLGDEASSAWLVQTIMGTFSDFRNLHVDFSRKARLPTFVLPCQLLLNLTNGACQTVSIPPSVCATSLCRRASNSMGQGLVPMAHPRCII